MAATALGQRFKQPRHAAYSARLDAETCKERMETQMPAEVRSWVKTLHAKAPGDVRRDSVDYVVYCLKALPGLVSRCKKQFVRHYEKLPSIAPTAPSLVLAGQPAALIATSFTNAIETSIRTAYREEYANWNAVGFGSIQGISKAGGAQHPDLVSLQCTATGVSHTPDSNMWSMRLGAMDPEIQSRLVGCGVLALVYNDIMLDTKDMTLTAICKDLIKYFDEEWDALDTGDGPCSQAINYRLNWLPFSADEAKYLAFGTKVPVDAIAAVVRAIQLTVPGAADFAVPAAADTRMTFTGAPVGE